MSIMESMSIMDTVDWGVMSIMVTDVSSQVHVW